MNVLVVSHPCVTPANQVFYGAVARVTDWKLSIVLPTRWRNEYGVQSATKHPSFRGSLIPLPVIGEGRIPLHCYRANMADVIRRAGPDVIYVDHEAYALAAIQTFMAAGRQRRRLTIGFRSAQNIYKDYPWPVSWGEAYVRRRADFAFAVSDEVGRVLQRKGYSRGVQVLPLGADVPSLRATRRNPEEGLVGYVGRLAPEKGVHVLLRALARPEAEGLRALIVGDGPARVALERLGRELGINHRVEWAGYVPHEEIQRAYARMAVLVVPSLTTESWKEQFGRIVVEALAAGVPVVTSDSGELPSLVEVTGGGWVVPEADDRALANALAAAISDPAQLKQRADEGRNHVEEHFSMDAVARGFVRGVTAAIERDASCRADG
jgi:glycosyltransferase involved in cell wall biosynthesis